MDQVENQIGKDYPGSVKATAYRFPGDATEAEDVPRRNLLRFWKRQRRYTLSLQCPCRPELTNS